MAGRSRKVRNIQSYINNIDAHTFSGPMKSGTPPKIGVTHNFWYNYQTQCNNNPNQVKKSYNNMVFLNINSSRIQHPEGFKPTVNSNYTYVPPGNASPYYDANHRFDNHYYRPYIYQR